MDFEDIFYHMKQNRFGKKIVKVMLALCILFIIVCAILFIAAIILASKYHTQIFDGFTRVINYLFGDSPDNVIRGVFKQVTDNFIKNLFTGE
jgi:predicted PurR-regulated permease PerM